jgi:hypothetical protein
MGGAMQNGPMLNLAACCCLLLPCCCCCCCACIAVLIVFGATGAVGHALLQCVMKDSHLGKDIKVGSCEVNLLNRSADVPCVCRGFGGLA